MSEEELIARIAQLQSELSTTQAQARETNDLLQMMMANGLDKFLTGHGFFEYGGGVDRLDTNGLGIMPQAGGGNRGLWLVQNFTGYPPDSTTGRYGAIFCPLFTASDNELLIKLQNAQNQSISIDYQLFGSGGAGTLMFENRHPTFGIGRAELIVNANESYFTLDFGTKLTPLGLSTDTADPPTFRNGYLWYRTDTNKYRGRANGATDNFAMEGWVTANSLAATRGNWKVFYSNGTGVFTELAVGAANLPLISNGVAAAPTFSAIPESSVTNLTTDLAAKLAAARGNWKVFYSNGTGVFTELALGAANTVLTSNGTTSAPTFTAPASGGGMKVQGSGYLVMPAAAAGISPAISAGAAWSNGAWSQVLASTSEADYIVGMSWGWVPSAVAKEGEVDIGTGGAGAEVAISTISMSKESTVTGDADVETMMFPFPIAIPTSTRIAVRIRSSGTANGPANIKLIYCKQADLVAL